MRRFYLLRGLLLPFICLAPLKGKIKEYQVQLNGELVEVKLTKPRPSVGCKILYSFEFKYAGTYYSKKAGCNFHDSHNIGQVIKLKHVSDMEIFLFPDEDIRHEFIAFGLLGIFGIFLLIKAIKKPA